MERVRSGRLLSRGGLWDLSNKNHSQFNLIKIDTILYKYVCTNIDTRFNCGGIAEYVADCIRGLIE
jgi:hypothetical protein